ncbi:RNA exonuclease 1 [Dendrobium catenatum]|uniref:RNA exonuclease 1 n=1 Tax=Dendrobium catenatum TaxID=906689 RepID=A0A2I0WMF2_9ASPA|nr:RNA exonuclease 1 [Dendrobium catenatum]
MVAGHPWMTGTPIPLDLPRVQLCWIQKEAMEEVLNGGPWYVGGFVIGLDKWTPNFSPLSLDGISAPIWVRLPHLPLQCWDETNITRIISSIGTPLLLDGNMFRWGRREFARACVRVKLNSKLPNGIFVEGIHGKFYQKFEFENLSSICFKCGRIGHKDVVCPKVFQNLDLNKKEVHKENSLVEDRSYGPWMHVKFKPHRKTKSIKRNYHSNQGAEFQPARRNSDHRPLKTVQNSEGKTAEIKGGDEVAVSINSNLLVKPNIDQNTNLEYNQSIAVESTDVQHNLPEISEFQKSNFEFPQIMEADKVVEELKLDFTPTSSDEQTAVIQSGIEGNLEFQNPQTLEAVEELLEEEKTGFTPSKAAKNSSIIADNNTIRDGLSNTISPSSTINLKFKKTVLVKNKKGSSLELISSGSKHKLFKELRELGPVKDQNRRRIIDHKEKNDLKCSSQTFQGLRDPKISVQPTKPEETLNWKF